MFVPLFTIGFTWLCLSFFTLQTDFIFCVLLCCFAVAFLIFNRLKMIKFGKNINSVKQYSFTTSLLVAVSIIIFFLLYLGATFLRLYDALYLAECYKSSPAKITGIITEVMPKSAGGMKRYIVTVDSIMSGTGEEEKLMTGRLKIQLSSKVFSGNVNDEISFESTLFILGEGDKSYENYYKAKGYILGSFEYSDVKSVPFDRGNVSLYEFVQASLRRFASDIQETTRLKLRKYLPDDFASIVLGMLIGEKSEMKQEYLDAFTKAGIVHLFSVSGFHTSLWANIIYKRLLKFGVGKRISCLFVVFFCFLFMLVTGFSRSTVRAGIMHMIFYLGRMFYREADSLNSLGLSACIVLFINPFAGGDVGFLLSFFSTLAILVGVEPVMSPIRAYLRNINDYEKRYMVSNLISGVVVSCCTFVFTFPFVVLFIGDVSLSAPLTNLLVGTAASTLVFFAGLGTLVAIMPLPIPLTIINMICYPVFLVVALLTKYVLTIVNIITEIPYTYVNADSDSTKVTLAAVLILWAVASAMPYSSPEIRRRLFGQDVIRFTEIYGCYGYRARLVFWLSLIIVFGSVLSSILIS